MFDDKSPDDVMLVSQDMPAAVEEAPAQDDSQPMVAVADEPAPAEAEAQTEAETETETTPDVDADKPGSSD